MRTAASVLVACLMLASSIASGAVPHLLSYQGVLRDLSGNVVPDGQYNLTFRIYSASSGGTALWTETQSLSVSGGILNASLGSVIPLGIPFDVPYWLGITVGATPELTPRVRLAAAPYALRAAVADSVPGGGGDTDWVESGGNVYRLTGNVGVGTSTPLRKLHVSETVAGGLALPVKLENAGETAGTAVGIAFKTDAGGEDRAKGALVYERTTTWNRGSFHILQNNIGNLDVASLANAVVTVTNDGNVGIGTTTPKAKLEVTSHVRVQGYNWPVSGKGLEVGYNPEQNKGYLFAYDRDTGTFGNLALGSGNVGIGTNYPSEMLHVNGVIYSSSGGIKFPDGTLQTTAGGGGGGGLVLPYAGTAATSGPAFAATNGGTGEAVRGTHSTSGNHGEVGTAYAGLVGYHGATNCYGQIGINGYGVWGLGYGSGTGVYGEATTGYGARGHVTSGTGVYGDVTQTAGVGVKGYNPANGSVGKLGTELEGVRGESSVYGVHGVSFTSGTGVYGESPSGVAVYGLSTTGTGVKGYASGTGGIGVSAVGGPGGYAGDFQGNVRIRGRTSGTTIIEFGEGLDYAEGFDTSGGSSIAPGTVLVIDRATAGKLAVCSEPYDTRVAGIVAGANGLGSAVRVGVDDFDVDVALAGRVYCNVDAETEDVEPGDLLTTSATPGYAMKVSDPERAQGAVLGKAMERLEKGRKGQILVLVALQ